MPAPHTTLPLRVRSYEIRPDGRAGTASFLNWFQEAAFANSAELGYGLVRYQEIGVTWVLRQIDVAILARPRFDEHVLVTTWPASMERARAYRDYEARSADGTLLARSTAQWVMLSLVTQRPTRIPDEVRAAFHPPTALLLPAREWPQADLLHQSPYTVSFFEEDEQGHVNNANYVNWIEESARRTMQAQGLPLPTFHRHFLDYRMAAFKDNVLSLRSGHAPHEGGLAWRHEIWRDEVLLLQAHSLSNLPRA